MNSILIYNYKHYNTATLGKSKIQRKFASLLTNLEIFLSKSWSMVVLILAVLKLTDV